MNKYKWSAKYNAFFPTEMLPAYQSSWDDLSDLIDIDDTVEAEFNGESPVGKVRGAVDGMPAWVDEPPLTKNELIQIAESEKQNRLLNARKTIDLWTIQLQLGIISDENKNKLTQWVKYIEAVQAVDTSAAPNIIWPAQPD